MGPRELWCTAMTARSMVIEMDGLKLSSCALFSGVAQGSVLPPQFFSIFVNCLPDDLQLYLSGDRGDLDGLIERVNENLENVARWSKENGLLLSPAKSQAISVSNSHLTLLCLCRFSFWVVRFWSGRM
jgi:hypothetical protein